MPRPSPSDARHDRRRVPGGGSDVTVRDVVERGLRCFAANTAVIDGERRETYADLADRSGRLANVVTATGSGRPVAVWLPNCLEYVEADVACMRAGATRVAVGDRLSADETEYILGHCGAGVLITTTELYGRLRDHRAAPAGIEVLLVDGAPSYEEALARATARLDVAVSPLAPSYLAYTSGTTGRPKGAIHTQRGRLASATNMLACELRRLDATAVFAHVTPVSHGSGSKIVPALASGAANLVLRRFDPDGLADAIRGEGVTHTFLVPTLVGRLLDAGTRVDEALRSLRQITFGGSPIAPDRFASAIDRLGPILTQIYGSTEVPHPVTVLQPEDYLRDGDAALATAGRPAIAVDIAVDGDAEAEPDRGELLIAAPHAMAGYFEDEAATERTFTPAGYYRSGDVVAIGPTGLVTFHDRVRDVVSSGGMNVYPSEVERALGAHPAVRQAVVVGGPDTDWGEVVVAYVVATDGSPPAADELERWVGDRLAGYKKPRRFIFVDELPVSPNGKVLRRELRDALWQGRPRQIG